MLALLKCNQYDLKNSPVYGNQRSLCCKKYTGSSETGQTDHIC